MSGLTCTSKSMSSGRGGFARKVALEEGQEAVQAAPRLALAEEAAAGVQQRAHQPQPALHCILAKGQRSVPHAQGT